MSATEKIVQYAHTLTFNDLPAQAIADVKIHILDTIGATLAGSAAECSQKLVALIHEWGGQNQGTVLAFGHKVPAHHAAWVNSVMSRGFDFETLLTGGATHVSASIIPAAFALCEYAKHIDDTRITGRDLITAVAIGCDLNWRFRVAGGESTIMSGGWLAETFAPPAIAALGGNLLGFDVKKIAYAMGIAYGQCCGNYGATVGDYGGFMAQLSQGIGATSGVLSVILANSGFTAYTDIIDGQWGLYHMFGDGTYDPDILVGDLGICYDAIVPEIKRFPGCGATQLPVYGALKLAHRYQIKTEQIDSVHLHVGPASYTLCGDSKFEPLNSADALWNHRYSIAVALTKNNVFVDDFTKEALRDPDVLALIPKIEVTPDPALKRDARIEIRLIDDQVRRIHIKAMKPVSEKEIIAKFKACSRFSIPPLPDEKAEGFIEMTQQLEAVDDVTALIEVLCSP